MQPFEYGPDGSFPEMVMEKEGVTEAVGTLNPFKRTEAEIIAWSEGLKIDENEDIGVYLTSIHNGDYLKVREVDFGYKGTTTFQARVASRYFGGSIELRIDSLEGDSVGTLNIPYLGDWDDWNTLETEVQNVSGIHDLYLIFKGREPMELFRFDYWMFGKKTE